MIAEFWCEGCGSYVVAMGLEERPRHQFCLTCLWLHHGYQDCILMDAIRQSNPAAFMVTRRADRELLRADFSSRRGNSPMVGP